MLVHNKSFNVIPFSTKLQFTTSNPLLQNEYQEIMHYHTQYQGVAYLPLV